MGSLYAEKIIMSIGGSIIVPNGGINTDFLQRLNTFIRDQLTKNPHRQFFLVAGGGATARHYRDAGKDVIGELTRDDLDWLGIHATRLNAHLLLTIFRDVAHTRIIERYEIIRKVVEPVVVAAGWKPGWSTDFCAVLLSEDYDVPTILNLSNIAQVYDHDPKTHPEAKPLAYMSWPEFRKLVPDEWTPGLNAPFDPIAAKKAEELGIKVVILSGDDLDNVEKFMDGKDFVGTVIES